MTEENGEPENFTLALLRRLDTKVDLVLSEQASMKRDVKELKDRQSEQLKTVNALRDLTFAIHSRVLRIEKHLGLVDA
jgi:hypothetical protein